MSLVVARAAIVAKLNSVPDIGVVHAYQRYAKNLDQLLQHYFSESHGQVRGWCVSRQRSSETGSLYESSTEITWFRIRGVMSVADAEATEITFDDLVESVRDAFRADITLGDAVAQCAVPRQDGEAGIQVEAIEYALFGAVLCHSARLLLPVHTHRNPQ